MFNIHFMRSCLRRSLRILRSQRIISQEPIANTDVLEELKQLLTTFDLDTMEEFFSLTRECSTNKSGKRA